jgi:hypothetical protein
LTCVRGHAEVFESESAYCGAFKPFCACHSGFSFYQQGG